MSAAVSALASETLSYVSERNGLWLKQDVRRREPGDQDGGECEFDGDNLPYLTDE